MATVPVLSARRKAGCGFLEERIISFARTATCAGIIVYAAQTKSTVSTVELHCSTYSTIQYSSSSILGSGKTEDARLPQRLLLRPLFLMRMVAELIAHDTPEAADGEGKLRFRSKSFQPEVANSARKAFIEIEKTVNAGTPP